MAKIDLNEQLRTELRQLAANLSSVLPVLDDAGTRIEEQLGTVPTIGGYADQDVVSALEGARDVVREIEDQVQHAGEVLEFLATFITEKVTEIETALVEHQDGPEA